MRGVGSIERRGVGDGLRRVGPISVISVQDKYGLYAVLGRSGRLEPVSCRVEGRGGVRRVVPGGTGG